jgi:glycoprotein endo-alpha-1,2-mannosidase
MPDEPRELAVTRSVAHDRADCSMRRFLIGLALSLCLPASAQAAVRVTAFYYPWYGTPAVDGTFQHWGQRDHTPPNDIASAYYPARGLYSSSDLLVVGAQMDEIRAAGIDEVAVSWWGRGSAEDGRLGLVAAAARSDGIAVAAHLEPYGGRSVASTVADVQYLRTAYGIKTFYVYRPLDLPVADWAAAKTALHAGGTTLFAQTALAGAAAAAGFDGVYTYDIVTYGGWAFRRLCDEAHAVKLLCAPSVGPGYDARRGSGDPRVKPRRDGRTYDSMWRLAIGSGADRVTITSYNEWHEGTQIEPAAPPRRRGAYRYLGYDGAWGSFGVAAEGAYLERTRYWADVFRRTSPLQPNTSAS